MPDEPPQYGPDNYIPYRVVQLEAAVSRHGTRLDAMEDRWLRLDGAFSLMKLTIGTSIASAVVAIIALLALLSGRAT